MVMKWGVGAGDSVWGDTEIVEVVYGWVVYLEFW